MERRRSETCDTENCMYVRSRCSDCLNYTDCYDVEHDEHSLHQSIIGTTERSGLPGDTDPNPKQVNAVGTHSGLQLEELVPKKRNTESVSKESAPKESELVAQEERGISRYAKYVKEIVANKMRLTEYETVALTEECSSRIQNKLPTKLKDLGSFMLQNTIGQNIHALGCCRGCLSASGIADIPVDFVMLNFEPDPEVPFILGRPFLAT
ncbi:uncharacterized protein LOC125842891 [Solanum stenotomum]|uniref:uncharacterized protein LOC125842891 n=1 Tax=Solanum stenotomum TaxID=172797 RepID=UPI0020D1534E|nr:uncharacterized protein LOC125842891 [Solanum stenotomum]